MMIDFSNQHMATLLNNRIINLSLKQTFTVDSVRNEVTTWQLR